jgi:predicted DNA-binding transcriptional regulator YafY
LFSYGGAVHKSLMADEYQHSKFKNVQGSCGSSWIICDILDEHELTVFALRFTQKFRILAPNEAYYQDYDNKEVIWEQDEYEEDEEDD